MRNETQKTVGLAEKAAGGRSVLWRLSVRAAQAATALPLLFGQAEAQLAADKNAPAAQRPAISAAPNGVPLVDIAAPNKRGLSHNKYQDFNIGAPGLILNNHNAETGISKLGGVVPGNPNLRYSGAADIILNEVTSRSRTALAGPAEIFGRRAELVIANPNGITCDGCGFINTPRVSLTSGVPQISGDGRLTGFDVRGGDVTFGARGANLLSGNGSVDVFDIVSRRVVFGGPVAGHDVGIAAGTGKFDYATREMKELADIAGKPEYAIDGSELGALQADKIKIVATEKGVGVRMRGDMAAHIGQINLSADGKISLNNMSGYSGAAVQSKSSSVTATKISSKKDIYIKAKQGISLQSAGADGNIIAESGNGLLSAAENIVSGEALRLSSGTKIIAGQLAAGGDLQARADAGIDILAAIADGQAELLAKRGDIAAADGIKAGGDLRLAAEGGSVNAGDLISLANLNAFADKNLTVSGDAVAQGNLSARAWQAINVKNGQLGAHGNIDAQAGAGIAAQSIIADKAATLSAGAGDIAAADIIKAGGGDLRLRAEAGSVNAGELVSFGDLLAQTGKDLTVSGNAIAQGSLSAQAGQNLSAGGAVIAGMNIAASQDSATGALVMNKDKKLDIASGEAARAGAFVSGGAMAVHAGDAVSYNNLVSYNSAYLHADRGTISIDKRTAAAGDINLEASALDLSNNRAKIQTGGTLSLTADSVNMSGSSLIYGGLAVRAGQALNISNAEIAAVREAGGATTASGTGDIFFAAPGLTTDEKTDILAERNLSVEGNTLDNSGQLAAGSDLRLSLQGDAVNRASGLIYAGGNGYMLTNSGFRNEYGAIIAESSLLFAGADGQSKSRYLENYAGLIQAGNGLAVKTQRLTNEADATPYITATHGEQKYQFDKPAHYDELGKNGSDYRGTLVYDYKRNRWGAGRTEDGDSGIFDHGKKLYRVDRLYNSKEEAYSSITLPDGASYRADNWVESDREQKTIRYRLNKKASMSVLTDTDKINNKPKTQGLMQAGGDLRIEADQVDNRYSAIEAGGNAAIAAGTVNNLGQIAYKITADKCAAGSTCYAYNADGSRDKNGDILRGAVGNIQKVAIDDASSLIKAGGLLDISAGQVNNSAAEGSVAGGAQFEKKPVSGDPLDALKGMTAGGALFAPTVNIGTGGASAPEAGAALRPEAWPAPKPDSGGFGGTVPGQGFVYETRASFLDVGKFYGSAYFLNRIGYEPEHRMLFLGDAYFENQLIDKQMRDLAGEGLGRGSFIPGDSAVEQMKILLDRGSAYMQAHGLALGAGLTAEQAAALDESMVLYVRQNLNGREVYAPVLYVSAADRAAQTASGAKLKGGDVRVNAGSVSNSGLLQSNRNMEIRADDILARGGGFAANGDILLASAGNIDLSGAAAKIGGVKAVLPTASVAAGGSALIDAGRDLRLAGAGGFAGKDLALQARGDVRIGSAASVNESKDADGAGAKARSVSQTGSQLAAGGSQYIEAGKNIAVSGSDMLAGEHIGLKAGGDIAIGAAERQSEMRRGHESAAEITQRGSAIAAGGHIGAQAGNNIAVSGSALAAGGDAALRAAGDLSIEAAREHSEAHLAAKGLKQNERSDTASGSSIQAGGSVAAQAQRGDVSIIGSGIAAGDKAYVEAGRDAHIAAAENSYHYDVKAKSKSGGVLGGSSKMARSEDTDYLTSSQVSGGHGAAISAGRDVSITASDIIAGGASPAATADGASAQASRSADEQADLSIQAGGNITAQAGKESQAASSSLSHSGVLSSSSKKAQSYDENMVGARLGAEGDIRLNSGKDTVIAGSRALAGGDIAIAGDNVSVSGVTERHESSSQSKKSGFGIGSSGDFASAYGKESKKQSQSAEVNAGSELAAGGDVAIAARKGDVTIAGSDIAAGRDIGAAAKNNVNIATVEEHYSDSEQSKKSGIGAQVSHSNSSASVGAGVKAVADKRSSRDVVNAGSSLSAGRDIAVSAGNDANLKAAQLAAGRDAAIAAGNNVNITAAENEHHEQSSHRESFAGVTATVSNGWLAKADQVTNAAERIARGGSIAGNGAIIGVNSIDYVPGLKDKMMRVASDALDKVTGRNRATSAQSQQFAAAETRTKTPKTKIDSVSKNKAQIDEADAVTQRQTTAEQKQGFFDKLAENTRTSVNVSAGFNASESKSSSDGYMPVGSKIDAGRKASVTAGKGDLHIQGSDITAGGNKAYADDKTAGDIALNAGKNITIESAQERNSSKHSSKDYGGSVGYDMASGTVTGDAYAGRSKGNSDSVIQHNSHIAGSGNVSINSGGDTNLRGAQVAGKSVSADIGGDLNIESRQDTVHVRNKSDSYSIGGGADKARNTSSAYNMGNWNGGYNKDRSKYDYASVIEQSGIYAGEGGFDIKTKGNTDLKGAVIASEAEAAKNRLETGSLTVSDIENRAHAEAKTEGFGWTGGTDPLGMNRRAVNADAAKGIAKSNGDPDEHKWRYNRSPTKTGLENKYWDGEYGAAKNVISNLLDNGSASKTTHGETKSAVAEGTITITDAEAQKERTGLTPEESIARLRRDTEGTQTAAAQIDLGKIEQKAKDERATKNAVVDEVYKKTDGVYENYFNQGREIYEVAVSDEGKAIVDENGRVLKRKLTEEEIKNLKPSDLIGMPQVFTNGIANDVDLAAEKAVMKAPDRTGPVYLVYAPSTDNPITEWMAAAYSKLFDNDKFAMSNITKTAKYVENIYGPGGLYLYGHSRGTLTIRNSMLSQVHNKNWGVMDGTRIMYYGAAANAQESADLYGRLGGKAKLGAENNGYDFVGTGRLIGGNEPSFETNTNGFRTVAEAIGMFKPGDVSSHRCYGGGAVAACGDRYGERYVREYTPFQKRTDLVKEADYLRKLKEKHR